MDNSNENDALSGIEISELEILPPELSAVEVQEPEIYSFSDEEKEYLSKLVETFSQYENYVYTSLVSLKLLIESENYKSIKVHQESIKDDELYDKVLGLPGTMQEFLDFLVQEFVEHADKFIDLIDKNALPPQESSNLETLEEVPRAIEPPPPITEKEETPLKEEQDTTGSNLPPPSMRPMPDQPE